MTAPSPCLRERDLLDALARLDSMVLLLTDPEEWCRRFQTQVQAIREQMKGPAADGQEGDTRIAAEFYRLCYRAVVIMLPKEWAFAHLCDELLYEAYIGPEQLGPLWDRLEAIRREYGWPAECENGDLWWPEDHLDAIPDDYAAWRWEYDEKIGPMEAAAFRAACEKYGVPEIADLRESDPQEFERRMEAGLRHDAALSAERDG